MFSNLIKNDPQTSGQHGGQWLSSLETSLVKGEFGRFTGKKHSGLKNGGGIAVPKTIGNPKGWGGGGAAGGGDSDFQPKMDIFTETYHAIYESKNRQFAQYSLDETNLVGRYLP